MKLLIKQFSPISRHFISLWSKYSPQHRSQTPSVYVPPLDAVVGIAYFLVISSKLAWSQVIK
jgi:hypothetical protein